MIRSRQIRRIMHVIIVKGEACRFMEEFDPILTSAVSKAQEGFMNQKDESGLFTKSTLNRKKKRI